VGIAASPAAAAAATLRATPAAAGAKTQQGRGVGAFILASLCAKMERRLAQAEESMTRYLGQLDTADRQEPSEALAAKTEHLKEKLERLASDRTRHSGY
jgi:hypothetical protein